MGRFLKGAAIAVTAGIALVFALTLPTKASPPALTVVSSSVSLGPSPLGITQASTHADCPSGSLVTGGGETIINLSGSSDFITSEKVQISRPDFVSGSWARWEAEIAYSTADQGGFSGTLTVYAVCFG